MTQPPLRDLSSGAPSGLSLDDGPKARVPLGSLPGPNATPRTPSSLSSSATQLGRPRARAPALQGSGSWAALVVGIAVAACGVTFAAWTTESANLDAALMPTFEHSFGIEPPHSTMGRGDSSAEELRSAATQAQADGDFPRAVVLWRRVKLRDATDPRALQLIPKLLSDLGDQGAP